MKYSFTVTEEYSHAKLSDFLHRQGVSTALIKKIKYLPRGILVDGARQNANYRVKPGEKVEIDPSDREVVTSVTAQRGRLKILYQDRCCMVIDKPRDMPCHPSFNHPDGTLANFFAGYWRDRGEEKVCRIVNRLDKNTSGLVLIALDGYTAEKLKTGVDKIYTAIVTGEITPKEGVIDLPIARRGESIITRCVSPEGQRAVTEYRTVRRGGGLSLVDITLRTGRTHQIRVHFSHIGHPLQGDDLYGGNLENIGRQALHCKEISFTSPVCGKVEVKSPLPPDMAKLAEKI